MIMIVFVIDHNNNWEQKDTTEKEYVRKFSYFAEFIG